MFLLELAPIQLTLLSVGVRAALPHDVALLVEHTVARGWREEGVAAHRHLWFTATRLTPRSHLSIPFTVPACKLSGRS